jgi:hypothetical protein
MMSHVRVRGGGRGENDYGFTQREHLNNKSHWQLAQGLLFQSRISMRESR